MKNRIIGSIAAVCALALAIITIYSVLPDNSPKLKFQKKTTTWLTKNDPVKLNGVKIGKIEEIRLSDAAAQIDVKLEKKVNIPKSAEIYEARTGLLGERMIQIVSKGGSGEVYSETDVIEISEPAGLGKNALSDLFSAPEKIDTIIAILRRIEDAQHKVNQK